MATIHNILKQHWGYSSFRKGQEEIINSALQGKDTLALLPTGGGKSICYQIPGLANEGLTLVISPLIALMHDQVEGLEKRGIRAKAITSDLSYREIDNALENAVYGAYKFLFVSPERLQTDIFLARLNRMNINLIAVDEAHCISQWGYDFRPAYLNISSIRNSIPKVPVLALTATATPQVAEDICEKLLFKQKHILRNSFKRDNLAYLVRKTDTKIETIIKMANRLGGSGVVYCGTRKATQTYAETLSAQGITATAYHAGLNIVTKQEAQSDWVTGKTQVICATNAFGMGIDKPDVRFVAHVSIPESPEAYFQEAGRAGRDGQKAFALLMYNSEDLYKVRTAFERSFPPIELIKRVYHALGNMLNLATGSGESESYNINLSTMATRYGIHPASLFFALKFLEKEKLLAFTESVFKPASFRITLKNRELYDYKIRHEKIAPFIDIILRSHSGCFEDYVRIKEQSLVVKTKLSLHDFRKRMEFLHNHEVLDYRPSSDEPRVTFLTERLHPDSVRISPENYANLKQRALERLEAMENYVQAANECRSVMLLQYFGETNADNCGHCDYCLSQSKKEKHIDLKTDVCLRIQSGAFSIEELLNNYNSSNQKAAKQAIDELLDSNQVLLINGVLALVKDESSKKT